MTDRSSPISDALMHALRGDASHIPQDLHERLHWLECLDMVGLQGAPAAMATLRERLEHANALDFAAMRHALRRGERLDALRCPRPTVAGDHYDAFDDIIAGLLDLPMPSGEPMPLPSDMVFYQPTPARHILDFLSTTVWSDSDVLIDLGCGLGHVSLLAALLTPARCIGIDIEPTYIDCARRSATALALERIQFENQDARQADLATATWVYLYTPFVGDVLRTTLDRLRVQTHGRQIGVATFGPCTPLIARESWLSPLELIKPGRIARFRS